MGEIETSVGSAANTGKKRLKRPKITKKRVIILILIIAALFIVLRLLGGGNRSASGTGEAEYTNAEVARQTIRKSLSGSGTLLPANSYTVTTLTAGDILTADFEEGDVVEKDQVLYQIDSSDASNNIERSQLSLSQAQRQYKNTADKRYVKAPKAGQVYSLDVKVGDDVSMNQQIGVLRDSSVMTLKLPFPADDAVGFYAGQTAEVVLDSTFETLSGVVTEVSGSDIVGTGNMITRNVTIEVKNPGGLTDGQRATATVSGIRCAGSSTFSYKADSVLTAEASGTVVSISAPEGSTVVKDQIILTLGGDSLDDQMQDASDSLRSAELSMENTKKQLDNYTISSPIAGTIVSKSYKAGDKVESGKQMCIIYDLSYLEMTLNIDELDISTISVGQDVSITADAVSGRSYRGIVTNVSVAGTTSGGTTTYPVTIEIDETEGLLPGMNVDAEIVISEVRDVLAVPNSAVNRGGLVLVTTDSPSAKNAVSAEDNPMAGNVPEGYVYVEVETGVSGEDYVEIKSGLEEGDTVGYIRGSDSGNNMMFMMGGGMPGGNMGGGGAPGGGGGGRPEGGGNRGGNGGGPGGGF